MDDMIPQVPPVAQFGDYPFPWRPFLDLVWAASIRKRRAFSHDAQMAVSQLHPEPEILGSDHIPRHGPCLVTCNHYSRPGFGAWWIALTIAAAVASCRAPDADGEIHWVMTAAWTFPESRWRRRRLTPITRWAFARAAYVYGFVTMPPMPPAPHELEARAAAIRRTLRLARRLAGSGGMIGLAPEGQDVAERLSQPPPGAGSFIGLLVRVGLPVLPVGVSERGGRLTVSFGPPFTPSISPRRADRDEAVAQQVMAAIARQLG
jgi:1-acyl-sn-glycerol-3-phosphate acyltransferase